MKNLKFILILFFPLLVKAQDFHFSQFYHSPLTLNPALTGIFNGDFRLAGNYRSQWGWASEVSGYRTFSGSADFSLLRSGQNNNLLGAGVVFYNQTAGDSRFQRLKIDLSAAVNKALSADGKYNLAAGLQAGYFQKSFDATELSFSNQWNGQNYDPGRSTGENTLSNKVSFLDLSAGILWYYIPSEKKNIYLGAALYHLTQPNQSFLGEVDELQRKWVVHGGGAYTLSSSGRLLSPYYLLMMQGKHMETVLGTYLRLNRYGTETNNEIDFSLGAFYRIAASEYRPVGSDAIILASKIEYKNLTVGLSYDVNISKLSTVSKVRGGPELAIIYIGGADSDKSKNRAIFCPTF